jgi:hypothetical protein
MFVSNSKTYVRQDQRHRGDTTSSCDKDRRHNSKHAEKSTHDDAMVVNHSQPLCENTVLSKGNMQLRDRVMLSEHSSWTTIVRSFTRYTLSLKLNFLRTACNYRDSEIPAALVSYVKLQVAILLDGELGRTRLESSLNSLASIIPVECLLPKNTFRMSIVIDNSML